MATRSILISYAGYPYTPSSLMPDNGLANLAGALIEAGHETLILDYGTVDTIRRLYPERLSKKAIPFCERAFDGSDHKYKPTFSDMLFLKYLDWQLSLHQAREINRIAQEICQRIAEFKPDFVGFKLWTGDGFSGSVQIAKIIRKLYPDLPICAGGPHVDIFRQLIIERNDVFDALVYGDGEETMVKLADCLKSRRALRGVPNLIYKENGAIKTTEPKWIERLDELPYPVYDSSVYPSMGNNQKMKIVTVDESRGCFMCCYFCPHPNKSGRKLRMKSPERFVDEIEVLKNNYSFTAFRYAGSATPTRLARRIADLLIQKRLDISYTMFGNISISRSEDFDAIKKSGCRAIFFGLESGSEDILERSLGKRFKIRDARKILNDCKASGIFTVTSIIFPAPFETEQSRGETLELLKTVRPDSVIVTFPIVIPTTEWALDSQRFGFKLDGDDFLERNMNYKVKWLFPPQFWKPLPFKLNGKGFREFTGMTSEFSQSLKKAGLLVGMPDDLALMSHFSDFKNRESEFFNLILKIFFAGDWEKAQDLNKSVNSQVTDY